MPPRPKSPYAVQKLVGEYYASVFHSCFGLETVALRFFNVYGERQDPSSPYSGVISFFMQALIERRLPTIFGDGEQTRDLTYVEDVASLCLKAATARRSRREDVQRRKWRSLLLNRVWDLLQKMEGVSLPARHVEAREGDVRDSQADRTAAARDLGHAPRFTLEEGLQRTLAWYKTQ